MEKINALLASTEAKRLAPTEVRRVVERVDAMLVDAVLYSFKFPGLPDHLITTDRVLERWASAPTGSLASDPDVYFDCLSPPLDPQAQEAVSDIVKAAPFGVCSFVRDWYWRTWKTEKQMAMERQMSRRQLGRERLDVLAYMRTEFLACPLQNVPNLVRPPP